MAITPIKLLVTITVSKTDASGQPTGDPLYNSLLPITADTDGSIPATIPAQTKNFEVDPQAGKQDWLEFFAVSPATPSKHLTFTASDGNNTTDEFTLDQPIAYWGEALAQLFNGSDGPLTELKYLHFKNSDGCPVDVTVYWVRNAYTKMPDPCPKKAQ